MNQIDDDKPNPTDLEAQEHNSVKTDDEDSTVTSFHDFVDYTPPEKPKILPPAKYKLFLLIDILVILAVWFADEADLVNFLNFSGWLSRDGANFLFLGIVVFVLTFGALDFFVTVLTFSVNDRNGEQKILGIGAWLKSSRSTWIYRYQNIFAEILAIVIRILEDGFRIFDAPPCPQNGLAKSPKCFTPCGNTDSCKQKVLKIEHRIDPTKIKEYDKWEDRMANALSENAIGLISVTKHSYTGKDEREIKIIEKNNFLQLDERICKRKNSETSGLLRVIKLTFRDLNSLNEWMVLPRRNFLMENLQPLLVVPDVIQIHLDRELPDAFTDIMIRQGEPVPNLPPLKWKVWWLTTIALYISINLVSSFMKHYYEFWGLNDAHFRVQQLVANSVTVFVVTYIMVPFLLFVFDHWIKRKEVETKVKKEPWRTINDGFKSIWSKILLTFAFYGGCAIAWIVKSQ